MCLNQKIIFIVLSVFLTTIGSAQTERWVYTYSGGPSNNSTDVASSIVYGLDGNLYAAGLTWGTGTDNNFTVISLTNFGSERWVYKYSASGGANSVCYGADGNIYAAGWCLGSDSIRHFTVVSLTTDGIERWVYQYPTSSSANSICYGIDGNIYAVGDIQRKILVVSLDTNGIENWHYIYNTPSSEAYPGQSIIYGLDGNIYVAGYSGSPYTDATVISLTSSGSERWVYLYNGPGNCYDYASCIVYGSDGNLYVFGTTCLFWGYFVVGQGLIISLTRSGVERLVYISSNNPNVFYCGVYGADGNLYGAGAFGICIPFLFVESVSNSGTYRWSYIDTTGWGWARDIAYGNDGNIYVSGIIFLSGKSFFTVISFAPNGSYRWMNRYRRGNSDINDINEAISVIYGHDGNIYAAGVVNDTITGLDFTVICLSSTGIKEDEILIVESRGLYLQILPKIIKHKAQIQYTILEEQKISLNLCDILGRNLATIVKGSVGPGVYTYSFDASNLSSGVYFLILEGEKETRTQKVFVVR